MTPPDKERGMTLKDELLKHRAGSRERLGAERIAVMEAATEALAADIASRPRLEIGDTAPDFTLPDVHGNPVNLADRLAAGPVVLIFYRGGWCPYCNIQLRALQRELPAMSDLGASLIAIAPQDPDNTLTTTEKNELAFEVLSDTACAVAENYGIAFELPDDLKAIYTGMGNVLPETNSGKDWRLPIPATFVVGQDGRLAFVDIDADYRNRAEPADVLKALESISGTIARSAAAS
jgi:peroxiredoxin